MFFLVVGVGLLLEDDILMTLLSDDGEVLV
jgi:hypothetical protein